MWATLTSAMHVFCIVIKYIWVASPWRPYHLNFTWNFCLVGFLSALYATCNKLYWCGIYTILMVGLISNNGHVGIKYVSHLSNMCHSFSDLSTMTCCISFNYILPSLYVRLVTGGHGGCCGRQHGCECYHTFMFSYS